MSSCRATNAKFWAAARTAVPALLDEVERLEAEVDRLRMEVDESSTQIVALAGERDEARANYGFMVERAADAKLDGYRELGARAAKAENERDDALAGIARLRAWVARAREAMVMALHEMDHHRVGEHNSARLALRAVLARKVT